MRIGHEEIINVMMKDGRVEQVKQHRYLGSMITDTFKNSET